MQFFSRRFFQQLPVTTTHRQRPQAGKVLLGDCTQLMAGLMTGSVDFILTDPPYITGYRDRAGRTIANDDNGAWLMPAAQHMYRVLKEGGLCVSFYGWPKVDLFMAAWRKAGFRPVGHLMFSKPYASRSGFLKAQHECAYLLAKGDAQRPTEPIGDVLQWRDTGNKLHPTQKPLAVLKPLIEAFTRPGQLVLDPFCGSGSTLAAAADTGRRWLGIELDPAHHATATQRLAAKGVA